MWLNKKKVHEFFNSSIDMVDTCNKDVQKLQSAVISIGDLVDAMRKLVEIQEKRIGLQEEHNIYQDGELVSLREDLVTLHKAINED
jgi:hypothetical protein